MKINSLSFSLRQPQLRALAAPQTLRALKWNVLSTDRSRPHVRRKAYHCAMGLLCFTLYAFVLTRDQALTLLTIFGGGWILCDLLRFRSVKMNEAALKMFGPLMRREEVTNLTANSFYILGLLAILPFFPKSIVLLSVLFLALGDPIAAVVGTRWGKRRLFGKKSLEGALANFIASAAATSLFSIAYLQISLASALGLSLIGGIVSVLSELIPTPVNDNLTIPVFSAFLLSIFSSLFPMLVLT